MSPTAGSVREGSGSTGGGGGGRESLADLWAGFLERSVEEASAQPPNKRKDSMSSTGTGNTSGGTHSGFLGFGKGGGGEGKGPLGI